MVKNTKSTKNTTLTELVSQLSVYSQKDEYKGIVSTATSILKQSPNDKNALDTLVSAYIKHDRYSDFYKYFENNKELQQSYLLEYGYALYRLGYHKELTSLIESREERGFRHLLAQSYYKQGQIRKAKEIYDTIINTPNQVEFEDHDLSVNERAIIAQLKLLESSTDCQITSISSPKSYDQLFNDALIAIANLDYTTALDLLSNAKVLCQNTSYAPEEMASEITPILFQASLVQLKLNKPSDALEILNSIDYENLRDPAMKYLIYTLKLSLKKNDEELSNPYKAIAFLDKAANYSAIQSQFVPLQRQTLNNNRFLLELASGKSVENLIKSQSKLDTPAFNSLQAYAYLTRYTNNTQSNTEQMKALNKLYSVKKTNVALAFLIAQIYANNDSYSLAAIAISDYIKNTKEKNPEQAFAPGVIAALSSLYTLAGRESCAIPFIEEAVTYWSKNASEVMDNNQLQILFADSSYLLATSPALKLVSDTLENLYKQDPSNIVVISGLLGLGDPEISQKYSKHENQLISIQEATRGIDAKLIASSGLEPLLKKRAISSLEQGKVSKGPAKKKKMGKLPKNYDESKTPDPERWIPLKDRSTYKPPKAKGKKKVLASTQGGQADESLDLASSSTTSTAKTTSSSKSKAKAKNIKKKKGKGRK